GRASIGGCGAPGAGTVASGVGRPGAGTGAPGDGAGTPGGGVGTPGDCSTGAGGGAAQLASTTTIAVAASRYCPCRSTELHRSASRRLLSDVMQLSIATMRRAHHGHMLQL